MIWKWMKSKVLYGCVIKETTNPNDSCNQCLFDFALFVLCVCPSFFISIQLDQLPFLSSPPLRPLTQYSSSTHPSNSASPVLADSALSSYCSCFVNAAQHSDHTDSEYRAHVSILHIFIESSWPPSQSPRASRPARRPTLPVSRRQASRQNTTFAMPAHGHRPSDDDQHRKNLDRGDGSCAATSARSAR